jgi:hypothetical protein
VPAPEAQRSNPPLRAHRPPLGGDRFGWPLRVITDLGAVAIDATMGGGDRCTDRRRAVGPPRRTNC